MKTNINKAFYKVILFLFCFIGYVAHAGTPECPTCPDHPPTEDLPIDGSIITLFIVAVLFGLYIIHNYNINKKRAI